MHAIPPYPLWIGHAGDGRDSHAVIDAGIQAIVQVAQEEPPLQLPRELIYCRFPLLDSAGNDMKVLNLAITMLANLVERHVPTLVCCGGGMSRSPCLAAAAVSMIYQEEPDECLKQIAEHHPHDVVPGLWSEVKSYLASQRC
jgi:protein-tyrosine phosphatase